uniref:Uncharacterized protein n=1 Tax=Trichogramma kaykai TaxID=54128 RepID=A0ABD2X007_9HYME
MQARARELYESFKPHYRSQMKPHNRSRLGEYTCICSTTRKDSCERARGTSWQIAGRERKKSSFSQFSRVQREPRGSVVIY